MPRGKKDAGIPYDVRGVDSSGGDFELLPVGLYRMKIEEVVYEEPADKDPRVVVTFRPVRDAKGKKLKGNFGTLKRYYTFGESARGFWRQFLEAVGIVTGKKGEKGTLDPAAIEGQEVLVRVRHEIWKVENGGDGEPRAKVGNVMPLPDDSDDDVEDEDLDDEDVDDEDDVEDDDDEDDDDDDESDEEDEEEEEDDEEDEDEEDEDDEDDEDEDDEDEERDWSDMSIAELEQAVKDNDGKVASVVGRGAKAKKGAARKKALVKWLEENAGEDDEEVDYSEWDLDELREELKEREESTKGSKAVLVKRLEKLDEADSESDPF